VTSSPAALRPKVAQPPVHITGVGAVTGFGWGREALFTGFAEERSAVVLQDCYPDLNDGKPIYLAKIPNGGDPADGHSLYPGRCGRPSASRSTMPQPAGGSRDQRLV
jgi:hypothetical protein